MIHPFTAKVYRPFTAKMIHSFTAEMYHSTLSGETLHRTDQKLGVWFESTSCSSR
jgi:hypothetical protein